MAAGDTHRQLSRRPRPPSSRRGPRALSSVLSRLIRKLTDLGDLLAQARSGFTDRGNRDSVRPELKLLRGR